LELVWHYRQGKARRPIPRNINVVPGEKQIRKHEN